MALLRKVGYRQIKLLEKTTEGNLGPEKSGLKREKDLKGIKKVARSEQEAERPERKVEREIREKAGLKRKVEREKRKKVGPKQKTKREKEKEQ